MIRTPTILCIGGHDPTGGAGIQADIETVNALGARPLTLVSCLTAQDTGNVYQLLPTPRDAFVRQCDALLGDIRPDAIKIGVLGSAEVAQATAGLLIGFDGPVVLDPVLAAGGGFGLAVDGLIETIRRQILPWATLLTPNRAELRRLANDDNETSALAALLADGPAAILVTGADEAEDEQVSNTLYQRNHTAQTWQWPRLPQVYHGSGCTLASACAARLALGDPLVEAVEAAQQFTWQALNAAEPVGRGQWLPRRIV